MFHTVVVADDVTGANDIGIMYAKAGLKTLVYSQKSMKEETYEDCDVLVIDTDSRFDEEQEAYRKVEKAVRSVPGQEVKQFIDKQCSVFRGNIGAEFDAMLDTLGETFAVVVLGFPDNGRTTLHSQHYVHGTLLEHSQFRNDPVHPMTCSDLVEILKSQTRRPVGAIHYEVYEQGRERFLEELEACRKQGGYCILDVRDNNDLVFLADALKEERVICGSSALSEYLAKVQEFPGEKRKDADASEKKDQGKVFCAAGSLTPQTIGQTAYMKEHGYCVFELDTRKLLDTASYQEECGRLERLASEAYQSEDFVMIHSMNQPEQVEETKRLAAEKGIDNTQVSTLVSGALARIARTVVEKEKIRRIIVCGGDTSASLCERMEICGMQVQEEIETGLPTCQSVRAPYYQMVLKSGSFGSPAFVEKALEKLKQS